MSGRLEQSRRGGGRGAPRGPQQWEGNGRSHVPEGRREMMPSWADGGGGGGDVGPSYHGTHNTRDGAYLGSERGVRDDQGVRYDTMGGDDVRGATTMTMTQRGEGGGGYYQQQHQQHQHQHRHRDPQRQGSPPSNSSHHHHHHHREQEEYGYAGSLGAPGGAVPLHRAVPVAATAANTGVSRRASSMHNPVDHEELARIQAKKDAYRRDLEAQVRNEKTRLCAKGRRGEGGGGCELRY